MRTSRCYFFLAGANFWEKHAKNRRKQVKTRENRQKTGAFLVLIFLGEKLVGANFYAFCNYVFGPNILTILGGSKSSGTHISENHLGTGYSQEVGFFWARKLGFQPQTPFFAIGPKFCQGLFVALGKTLGSIVQLFVSELWPFS